MRNYALNEARSRLAYGRLTVVLRVVKNWRARRAMKALYSFDDHMLRDIGLTRSDLDRLLRQPLSADIAWESERLRLLASRSGLPK